MFNADFPSDADNTVTPVAEPDGIALSMTELAMLIHDLRTPVLSILGLNAISETDPDADTRRSAHARVDSVAHHLLGIVNDLLFVARSEHDGIALERLPVSAPRLLGDVLAMVQPSAEARQVELKLVMEYDLPLEFIGDPQRLRQVLINLISNAIRFSSPQTTVKLRAGLQLPQAFLFFSIEDEGPGMTPDELARLFRPFQQIGRISGSSGSGLGLAISEKLVRSMQGRIEVESAPGKGSRFTVLLPYCARQRGSAADAPAHLPSGTLSPDQRRPLKILVVDDNPIVNEIVTHVARRAGHTVSSVLSGAAALEHLSTSPCDLVLLDHCMDDLDGLETARRIRAMPNLPKELQIIGLTAHLAPGLADEAKRAGMNSCLQKTTRPRELMDLIDAAFASV